MAAHLIKNIPRLLTGAGLACYQYDKRGGRRFKGNFILLPPKLQRRGLVFKRKLVTVERVMGYYGTCVLGYYGACIMGYCETCILVTMIVSRLVYGSYEWQICTQWGT